MINYAVCHESVPFDLARHPLVKESRTVQVLHFMIKSVPVLFSFPITNHSKVNI